MKVYVISTQLCKKYSVELYTNSNNELVVWGQ